MQVDPVLPIEHEACIDLEIQHELYMYIDLVYLDTRTFISKVNSFALLLYIVGAKLFLCANTARTGARHWCWCAWVRICVGASSKKYFVFVSALPPTKPPTWLKNNTKEHTMGQAKDFQQIQQGRQDIAVPDGFGDEQQRQGAEKICGWRERASVQVCGGGSCYGGER